MSRPVLLLAAVLALALAGGGLLLAGFAAPARWTLTAAALPVALLVARDTMATLLGGRLGVDIVALVAIVAALLLGEPATAAIIAGMVSGGGALEAYAEGRARRDLAHLLGRTPRTAQREEDGQLIETPVDAIRPGHVLLVRPGDILPVDGILLDASASLDESALTGEPLPVSRAAGDALRSGTVNAGGPLRLQANATAEGSTYAAVVRLVHDAEAERPPMVRLADRWALAFLPVTLLASGVAWLLSGDPTRALAVLVVATPCPLILAAPVALIAGVARAARHGVIVKGGGALERLARVRTVLFDKTGTLTTGTPRLAGIEPLDGFAVDEVLRLAASLEQVSQHVTATAIVTAARAAGLALTLPTGVEEAPGAGLVGTVEGREVRVGSAGFIEAAGLGLPDSGPAARLAAAAASASWVTIDGRLAGALLLADRIRPEAPRAVRDLRSAGVGRIVMVSGDRMATAEAVGAALGLDAVHADLTPAGKITTVAAERPCMMVGDGINDAPALAAADVGLAMGAKGAAAAAEAADAVLLVDRIDRIATTLVTARRARAIALQSIAAGMALSAIAMAVAGLGYLPPFWGAVVQEAIDVAVILNALRVLADRAAPTPIPAAAGVPRVLEDHARLRDMILRMRRAADAAEPARADLDAITLDIATVLLPHQRAEERVTFPILAKRLGGHDPLGAMARMHDEIHHLATRYTALVEGLADAAMSPAEARELRRLLTMLDAIIGLHLVAEEELMQRAEEAA